MSLGCHLQQADHVLAQRSRKERVFCCALKHSWKSCSPFINFQSSRKEWVFFCCAVQHSWKSYSPIINFQSSRKRMSFVCCALQNSWKSCGPFMNFQRKVCEYASKQVRCFFSQICKTLHCRMMMKVVCFPKRSKNSGVCSMHVWKASQARTKAETKKSRKKKRATNTS
jgi:hypothetical protein